MVRTWSFTARGLGSVPSWRTNILQAARQGQKKKRNCIFSVIVHGAYETIKLNQSGKIFSLSFVFLSLFNHVLCKYVASKECAQSGGHNGKQSK